MLVHASASTHQHGFVSPAPGQWSSLLTFRLRRDGFAYATPVASSAAFTTRPVLWRSGEIAMNVDCGSDGHIWVAVLDSDGKEVPGYGLAQAQSFGGNATHATARWVSGKTLNEISNRSIGLRVHMQGHVKLFSLRGDFSW